MASLNDTVSVEASGYKMLGPTLYFLVYINDRSTPDENRIFSLICRQFNPETIGEPVIGVEPRSVT